MAVTVGIGVGKGEQTSIRKTYTAFEKHNNGRRIMAVTVGIGVGKGEQTSIRKIYTAFEKHNNGRGIHFHFMLSIISYITKCE